MSLLDTISKDALNDFYRKNKNLSGENEYIENLCRFVETELSETIKEGLQNPETYGGIKNQTISPEYLNQFYADIKIIYSLVYLKNNGNNLNHTDIDKLKDEHHSLPNGKRHFQDSYYTKKAIALHEEHQKSLSTFKIIWDGFSGERM